jgi:hypothetical protein
VSYVIGEASGANVTGVLSVDTELVTARGAV